MPHGFLFAGLLLLAAGVPSSEATVSISAVTTLITPVCLGFSANEPLIEDLNEIPVASRITKGLTGQL